MKAIYMELMFHQKIFSKYHQKAMVLCGVVLQIENS